MIFKKIISDKKGILDTKLIIMILVILVVVVTIVFLFKSNTFGFLENFLPDLSVGEDNEIVVEGVVEGNCGKFEKSKIDYDFNKEITIQQLETAINYAKNNKVIDRQCNCNEDCQVYAKLIYDSSKNKVNPLLVLAIMIQESSCKPLVGSDSSFGLMQINLKEHCGKHGLLKDIAKCKKELQEPETNIRVGVEILLESYSIYSGGKKFSGACSKEYQAKTYDGWAAALRGYNGWGCNPKYPQQDCYVEQVLQKYELLIEKFGTV